MSKKQKLDHGVKVHNPEGFSKHDVSVELERVYRYADGTEFAIKVPETLFLKRDERGDSHRIVTKDGWTWYPKRGWIAIGWRNHDASRPVEF